MDPLFNYYDTVNFRSILGDKKCEALEIYDRVDGDRDIDYYAPRKIEVGKITETININPSNAPETVGFQSEKSCATCIHDKANFCLKFDWIICFFDKTWRSWKDHI